MALIAFCAMQCTPKEKNSGTTEVSTTQPAVNDQPTLTVRLLNGQTISLRDLNGNVMLIFFNPSCDHCEREAEQIKNRKQLFANHTLYFVSTESVESLTAFANKYELTDKNFVFAQADAASVFESVGNLPSVPAIFIYKDHRLIKRFDGETSLDVIQSFL